MNSSTRIYPFIVLFCFLVFCPYATAKTQFIDSDAPPPGFESIRLNQHLRVSVFFMHRYVGLTHVTIHQGQLTFYSPELLLAQLKQIKNRNEVFHLLKHALNLNSECTDPMDSTWPLECEQLKEKALYIIYKPTEAAVYLYLAPRYFKKPKKESAIELIPNSTSDWSYLNKLGASGSFNTADILHQSTIYPELARYYNLYSNSIFAYRNSSIIGNISQNNGLNEGQHFQVQNLYAQHIQRDKVYTGGYLINPNTPFLQNQIILGAGVRSTLDTVKNNEQIMATPLVIFVPQASQVSIFKNEQLIYSQYLEAGYQTINTNGFPDGGYELIIKVGSSAITRRFFSKGSFLPPMQAPQFYVMGGYLTNGILLNVSHYNFLPKVLNIPVVQAGVNVRINERLALLGDVLINSHQGLFDFGPSFILGNALIKTAGLITSKNNYGAYALVNAQIYRMNLNLIAMKIFYQNKSPYYYFLDNLMDNDSISVGYRMSERDLLGIQASYTKSLDQRSTYSSGCFFQRLLGNYHGMGFYFDAAYNKQIYVGDTYTLGLSMSFTEGKLAGMESLLWQNQNKNAPPNDQVALPVVGQGSTTYSHANDQGIGYSVNEMHTFSPTVTSIAGIYNDTSQQGFAAMYLNYNSMKRQSDSWAYGGDLETELAMNQNGVRFNGLQRGNTSGLLIQVKSADSSDQSAQFALLDRHHRKVALLRANKKVFISLPAFTDEEYTLVNWSRSDYLIQDPIRHITLYPGNIGRYSWTVEKRIIVIGRVFSNSEPLANTWIHADKNGIFTDAEGHFQLELAQDTHTLTADDRCHIDLPKLTTEKAYLYIGDVSCS